MKQTKFKYPDYEKVIGFRLTPTQEECDAEYKKMPYLRLCPHCHKPVVASEFACGNCGETNLKVVSK